MRIVAMMAALLACALAQPHLDVYTAGAADAPLVVAVVCGQHARESISRAVCAEWRAQLEAAGDERLTHMRVVMVADANPEGTRRVVDGGEQCWRGNARGVDLNRNWPRVAPCTYAADAADEQRVHFGAEERAREFGGEHAFSEWETRALADELVRAAPDLLLVVHSGANAVLTPYDSCDMSPANYPSMVRVARWLTHGVQPRPLVGQAARELYPSAGTLADYALVELGVPLVYTLEVFESPVAVGSDDEAARAGCAEVFNPLEQGELLAQWSRVMRRLIAVDSDNYASLLHAAGRLTFDPQRE